MARSTGGTGPALFVSAAAGRRTLVPELRGADGGDRPGRTNHSYIATEENFRTLREFQRNNLLVPIVGDFGGDKAIQAVAATSASTARRPTSSIRRTSSSISFRPTPGSATTTTSGRCRSTATARSSARTSTWGSAFPRHHHARPSLRAAARSNQQPAGGFQGRRVADVRRAGGPNEVPHHVPTFSFPFLLLCYVPPHEVAVISAADQPRPLNASVVALLLAKRSTEKRCSTCHQQSHLAHTGSRRCRRKCRRRGFFARSDSAAMMFHRLRDELRSTVGPSRHISAPRSTIAGTSCIGVFALTARRRSRRTPLDRTDGVRNQQCLFSNR